MIRYFSAPALEQPQLVIHSAFYGTGPKDDMDVTEILKRQPHTALAFQINNNLFGRDPAPGTPKRLHVEYSYGNPHRITVDEQEGKYLVLPKD